MGVGGHEEDISSDKRGPKKNILNAKRCKSIKRSVNRGWADVSQDKSYILPHELKYRTDTDWLASRFRHH